jgi:hypothetical protein
MNNNIICELKCCSRCRSLLRTHMIKTSSKKQEIANETEENVDEILNSTE